MNTQRIFLQEIADGLIKSKSMPEARISYIIYTNVQKYLIMGQILRKFIFRVAFLNLYPLFNANSYVWETKIIISEPSNSVYL